MGNNTSNTLHGSENNYALSGSPESYLPSGETLLTASALGGLDDLIIQLLQKGANVNKTNKSGNSALHQALRQKNIGATYILLEHGANVNQKDRFGYSPLQLASHNNDISLVRHLLEKGAEVDANSSKFLFMPTVFDIAVDNDNIEMVKLFLQQDINRSHNEKIKSLPLMKAVARKNKGMIKLLVDNRAQMCLSDAYGKTPLQNAIKNNDCQIVEIFMKSLCKEWSGTNPISWLNLLSELFPLVIGTECNTCFKLFIHIGVNINKKDSHGYTPLFYALSKSSIHYDRCKCKLLFLHGEREMCSNTMRSPSLEQVSKEIVEALVYGGGSFHAVWDTLLWPLLHNAINEDNLKTLTFCIQGYGLIGSQRKRTRSLFINMASSNFPIILMYIYLSGFTPTEKDIEVVTNIIDSRLRKSTPGSKEESKFANASSWMNIIGRHPRSLQNLATVVIRSHLGDNIFYKLEHIVEIPLVLKQIIILKEIENMTDLFSYATCNI